MSRAAVATVASALFAAAAAGACVDDKYTCETDADCDLGAAGRCEVDHRCTAFDASCPTGRRYTAHNEALSDVCYEPVATPIDPCAAGLPPAPEAGCAATVCATLPTCCTTGWSAACAQAAQLACPEVRCDLRVAITAVRGTTIALYELVYDGAFTARAIDGTDTLLAFLAPAPGGDQPRLAGLTDAGATLVIGEGGAAVRVPLVPGHTYQDLASIDFDRDLRDKVALSWQDAADPPASGIDVIDLGAPQPVSIVTPDAYQRATWGDRDRDAFPDLIAGQGNRYTFLDNTDGADHARTLVAAGAANSGAGRAGVPNLRSYDWSDIDGDGALDLVQFGNSANVHIAEPHVGDIGNLRLDCDPPYVIRGGNACPTADDIGLVGAALPLPGGTSDLIVGDDAGRNLYRVVIHHVDGGPDTAEVVPIALPVCKGTCSPIRAVIVRDLDGDHAMDVLALDAELRVLYTLSAMDPSGLTMALALPVPNAESFTSIQVSISGALIP
jgi:hypothetical protein